MRDYDREENHVDGDLTRACIASWTPASGEAYAEETPEYTDYRVEASKEEPARDLYCEQNQHLARVLRALQDAAGESN